ncbi:MAG: peptide-methionine (R)-S-oxide reductase MsrB [Pikeienuella sp.]
MTKIVKSDAEWRAALDPETYRVTRRAGTEPPGSHPGFPKAAGTFRCACCDAPLFDAGTKYESGCGWPSFYAPIEESAVEEKEDLSHMMRRTEVLCTRCDAHLGHVFPDGPRPTGLRYCMNGVAMKFEPEAE